MVVDEIKSMLQNYFDVLQTQEMVKFDKVFYPKCVLYSAQDGVIVARTFDEYRAMVQGRKSPQSLGSPRSDEVLMIDVISTEMALAKVRLRLFDNIMVDYLNLMKIDGQWMVVAKHFHRAESVKS